MISIMKNKIKKHHTFLIICHVLCIILLDLIYNSALAQRGSYKIHIEDLLEISFWESPEMDGQIRVNNDGTIALPVIGHIEAEGLTIEELSQKIITQMGMYNKLINQVDIKVLEFGQNKVHVTGQVTTPGKYSFEEIPNLWDIILEAGGPLEEAKLDEVVIIRNDEEGKITTVNVANALRRGEVNELPTIYPGDAIHVPGASSPFGVNMNNTQNYSLRNEFYITGAIGVPGIHQYENNLSLLDAIGRAGGPTADADLEEVKYISVHNKGTFVMKIDLEYYINNSITSSLPTVSPGSTIYIPREKGWPPVLQAITISVVSTTLSTLVILYITDAYQNR
jgi:protein involved in polysaccharide export with SLBB domain